MQRRKNNDTLSIIGFDFVLVFVPFLIKKFFNLLLFIILAPFFLDTECGAAYYDVTNQSSCLIVVVSIVVVAAATVSFL